MHNYYLLSIVGIHLNDHVYHISITEMNLSFSHSLSARVLSHEADMQSRHYPSLCIRHFSSQVAGSFRRRLRDLSSSATLDRWLLYISLDSSGPGDVVVFIVISDNINQQLLKTKYKSAHTLNWSGDWLNR